MCNVYTVMISYVATQIHIIIIKTLVLLFIPGVQNDNLQVTYHSQRYVILLPVVLTKQSLKTQHTFLHTHSNLMSHTSEMYLVYFLVHPSYTSNIENVHCNRSLNITKYNLVKVTYAHLHQQYTNKYLPALQHFFQSQANINSICMQISM
jgi:hypothetical protein